MLPRRPPLPRAPRALSALLCLALLCLSLAPAAPARAAGVIYVKPGGSGAGTSWAEASPSLQIALAAAASGDEIWVAAGTYTPGTLRTDTFTLKGGVAIYGGFAGTESVRDQRDWVKNVVTLSGDLLGDDGADFANNADNSYHVVTGATGATLDGVTISGGNADGTDCPGTACGGGMYNNNSSPTLSNVTFSANSASRDGGGMENLNNSSPTLSNITFSANSASRYGGGMTNWFSSSPTLSNVTFSANRAAIHGGGMENLINSSPTLSNVTFSGNSAATSGGGISNIGGSNPTIRNSILWGNTAPSGPEITNTTSTPSVSYSLVQGGYAGVGNLDADPLFISPVPGPAPSAGGDLHLQADSPAINTGDNSGVAATDLDGNPRIIGGTVDMGAYERQPPGVRYVKWDATGSGSGYSWADAMPSLAEALAFAGSGDEIWVAAGSYTPGALRTDTFQLKDGVAVYGGFAGTETLRDQRDWSVNLTRLSGDLLGDDGAGFANNADNSYRVVTGATGATLDGVTISGGNAIEGGCPGMACGGGMYNYKSSPTLSNVTFSSNSAALDGGGMINIDSSSPTLSNVTFSANSAALYGGGGISNWWGSNPTLSNVTFSANSANRNGGGMYNQNSSPTLSNVTFSANSADYSGGGMYNQNSSPTLSNVTFSGNHATTYGGGISNFASNPSIRNSILWGDTAPSGPEIYNHNDSAPTITSSLVQGSGGSGAGWDTGLGTDGGNNLDADPLFIAAVPAPAPSTGGNLRLRAGSPTIDKGDDSLVPAGVTTDRDGNPRIVDIPGVANGPTGTVDMGAYEVQPPAALSITRANPSPTNAATVGLTVSFNMPVSGVDVTDFTLSTSGGQGGATVGAVSGGGNTWTVAVNTVAGQSGTIRLDLIDDDTISTSAAPQVPLGGDGLRNGDFTSGEVYAIDRVAPTVTLSSSAPNPTAASPIPVSVTFSEPVAGFTVADIVAGNATVGAFSGGGASYQFALTPLGDGTVTADIAAGVAADAAGNPNFAAAQLSRSYAGHAPGITYIYLPLIIRPAAPQ